MRTAGEAGGGGGDLGYPGALGEPAQQGRGRAADGTAMPGVTPLAAQSARTGTAGRGSPAPGGWVSAHVALEAGQLLFDAGLSGRARLDPRR